MVKKTNKRSIKNKRLRNKTIKRKRGGLGLFGFSSNADRKDDGKLYGTLYKYVYTFNYSLENGNKCITIKQKKAILNNWVGVTKYEADEDIGKLYIGSIFGAKKDRSMTARLLGSDKSGNKQNETEDENEFNANKKTWLSSAYAKSGLKRIVKYGRMAVGLGYFATGRWPETGYYMVTDINSNKTKTSFKFSRIYYFDKTEAANYFTGQSIAQQPNEIEKSNVDDVDDIDLNSSNSKCSYSKQESCLIGLKKDIQQKKLKEEEEITNGNENFINNIHFIKNNNNEYTFNQEELAGVDVTIQPKLKLLQQKFREKKFQNSNNPK